MSNIVVSKQFVELEIARMINIKKDLDSKKDLAIEIGEEDSFNSIQSECDFLIAGLYTIIKPNEKFGEYEKFMSNKDLLKYSIEFATGLERDLKGLDNV